MLTNKSDKPELTQQDQPKSQRKQKDNGFASAYKIFRDWLAYLAEREKS